jgi:hypothetical protein
MRRAAYALRDDSTGKTDASVAVLPIPASLVSILSAHRRRQRKERIAAGAGWRHTGLVFTTAHTSGSGQTDDPDGQPLIGAARKLNW